jgi:hypothetical protein
MTTPHVCLPGGTDLLSLVVNVINDADYWFPGAPGIRHQKAAHASNPDCFEYVFHWTYSAADQDERPCYRFGYTGYTHRPRPYSPYCH